jgi:hypothetical protein
MAEIIQWEYRVESVGTIWHDPKDQQIEALLNQIGEEGWEVIHVYTPGRSSVVKIIARRPLTSQARRQRTQPSY